MNSPLKTDRRRILRLVALAVLVLVVPSLASAAAGDLDPGFGSGGKTTTDFGGSDGANSVALQPDGKIVVAGSRFTGTADFAVARYGADGALDEGFGFGGRTLTDFDADDDGGQAVAVQPDGKIVVAGGSGTGATLDFALARYNGDGTLDSGFGVSGKVLTDFGAAEASNSIAIQADGKIVAAGQRDGSSIGRDFDFVLARYTADGSLDPTFGVGGRVVADLGANDGILAIRLQADGKIVAVGGSGADNAFDFVVARYTAGGALDTSFGSGGATRTDFGGRDVARSVALQPDGKIVAAGDTRNPATGDFNFALARYNADGTLDTTFGSAGRVVTDFDADSREAFSVALQEDGRIVLAGWTATSGDGDFALVRYETSGTIDSAFGSSGKVVTDFGGRDAARAVVVQPDGKIVAAGYAHANTTFDFAVARYLAEGESDRDDDGIPDRQDPDTVAVVVSALPDSAFSNGEHAQPFLYRLDAIEAMIAAGDLAGARTELQNLRRKVDGCGATADTNDWIVDCAAQIRVRTLIDDLIAHLGP
jgi:uncharacterized delta-60 repeat protein